MLFLWALCMMESINQAQSQTQTQAKLSLQCILLSDPPFPRGARYEGSKVEKNICWFVVLTEQIRDISCRHESTPSGEICLSFSVDDFKVCRVVFENSTKPVNYFFIRAILLVMKKRGTFSLKQKTIS